MESPDILSQLTLIFQNFLDEDDLVLKRETTADEILETYVLNNWETVNEKGAPWVSVVVKRTTKQNNVFILIGRQGIVKPKKLLNVNKI